ncbi:hypothetical protein M427DRAFT_53284, partial [Gonapodya prolifera JEL478]
MRPQIKSLLRYTLVAVFTTFAVLLWRDSQSQWQLPSTSESESISIAGESATSDPAWKDPSPSSFLPSPSLPASTPPPPPPPDAVSSARQRYFDLWSRQVTGKLRTTTPPGGWDADLMAPALAGMYARRNVWV